MRVLIIKTSSMGDIIHTLPAVTDAAKMLPSITFDWVVEEAFAEIPRWHSHVKNIFPVAIRRWKKNIIAKKTWLEWKNFREMLGSQEYDLVIDAQGLLKSAALTWFSKGKKAGFNRVSAREPLASLFYQNRFSVDKNQHAITRLRNLFSQAFRYELPLSIPEYGINRELFYDETGTEPYLVFLHATTWATKHWPEEHWVTLAKLANKKGYKVKLPWGNEKEKESAQRIATSSIHAEVLPRLNLSEMAKVLANAKAVVAVDTGLGHLTAALNVPAVSLYGPTDAKLTGALGKNQKHLSTRFPCSPCFSRVCTYPQASPLSPACFSALEPTTVWLELEGLLAGIGSS